MGLGKIVGGVAVAGLGLVGVGYAGVGGEDNTVRDDSGAIVDGGEIGAFRIQTGDCLGDIATGEFESAQGLPCDQQHQYEVYFAFNLPDGDYPGDDAVATQGDDRCFAQFDPFVGIAYEESIYGFTTLLPTQESWDSLDDREVLCLIGNYDETPKTGSARGTGVWTKRIS